MVSDFSQDNSDPEARRAPKPKFVTVPLDFWKPTSHAKPVDEGNSEISATDLVQPPSYEPNPTLSHSPTDTLLEAGLENMIEATNTDRQARDEGLNDEERAARIDEPNARLEDEAELRSERAAQEKERQEKERQEKERQEKERQEKERQEKERQEKERQEKERQEKERQEKERQEKERQEEEYDRDDLYREHKKKKRKGE